MILVASSTARPSWIRALARAVAATFRSAVATSPAPRAPGVETANERADALFRARRERLRQKGVALYRSDFRDGPVRYILASGDVCRRTTPTYRGVKAALFSLRSQVQVRDSDEARDAEREVLQ